MSKMILQNSNNRNRNISKTGQALFIHVQTLFKHYSKTLRNLCGTFLEPCESTHYVFSLQVEPLRNLRRTLWNLMKEIKGKSCGTLRNLRRSAPGRSTLRRTFAEPCGTIQYVFPLRRNLRGTFAEPSRNLCETFVWLFLRISLRKLHGTRGTFVAQRRSAPALSTLVAEPGGAFQDHQSYHGT